MTSKPSPRGAFCLDLCKDDVCSRSRLAVDLFEPGEVRGPEIGSSAYLQIMAI